MSAELKTFVCDCGFSWLQGKSGAHDCGPNYRARIAELEAALAKAQEDGRRLHLLVRHVIRNKTGCKLSAITDDFVAAFLEPIDDALRETAAPTPDSEQPK